MGTDAHIWIEYWPEDDYDIGVGDLGGEWGINRNYKLFAYMADVRNYDDVVPVATPRGPPEDTWADLDHVHSVTWLTHEEMQEAIAKSGAKDDLRLDAIMLVADFLRSKGKTVRFVIGFDS